ncbi:mucin-1 [Chelydra serpentina]|uniref:Mucin-1 n=1 Tax=Chelydra serpentina TaxID=8475 RepID=A0A8T1S7Y2_CHESE|nr:mucin-1 [Chelydra serpentina]
MVPNFSRIWTLSLALLPGQLNPWPGPLPLPSPPGSPQPLTAPACVSASLINTTSPTSAPAPLVPGWGIALLVLVCVLLVLSIVIFILLIVCSYRRRSRGKLDLLTSYTSYQPTSEYPTYHTHGRFSAPGKKQDPYNNVSSGDWSCPGMPPRPAYAPMPVPHTLPGYAPGRWCPVHGSPARHSANSGR